MNEHDYKLYEIFPFQQEYKDEYELVNNRYNFAFIINKDSNTIRTFMQSKDISTSNFQVKESKLEEIKLYDYNYEFYLNSVYPIATEVIRDKLYEVFNNHKVEQLTFIISVRKIDGYYPITVLLERIKQSEMASKTEGRNKSLLGINAKTLFQVKIVVSTNYEQNKIRIKESLPQDFNTFQIRRIKKEKVLKILNRQGFYTSIIGYLFNMAGWNMVRDTIINKVGLANIVQLPLMPSKYTLVMGQTGNISQGFLEEQDD